MGEGPQTVCKKREGMNRRRQFKVGDRVWYKGTLTTVMDTWESPGRRDYRQYKVEWGYKAVSNGLDRWTTHNEAWAEAKDLKRATKEEIVAETLRGTC